MNKIQPTEQELIEFIKIINNFSGIDLNDKKDTLSIKFGNFLSELKINSFEEFLNKLKISRQLRQDTLDFVTINETYFLRELQQLKDIIFYVKESNKRMSLLSAPCSSGEEVYSMAILAAQNFIKDISIVGIDINSKVIEKAKLGKYQGRTLQRLSNDEKRKYFIEDDVLFSIKKNELCHCRFELCNVFDDKFLRLGKFDIILSRNMIIYFDHESKIKLMERFHKILSDHGRLYVGNADLIPDTKYFKKVFSAKGTYYEKQ